MPQHECKTCPRCSRDFECKAGSITQCQCNQVQLSEATNIYIQQQYNDCLCLACLQELQQQVGSIKISGS